MTEDAKKLLEELSKLTAEERAGIAAALLAGLDGTHDPSAEEAWAKEIERRAKDAIEGRSVGIPWSDVEEGIRRKLGKA